MNVPDAKKVSSVFIETYGCQMNKSDSEVIAGLLSRAGYRITHAQDEADIILINTCSVRDHAEKRALGRIGVLSDWKNRAPHRKLGIIGCMAQRLGPTLIDVKPFVDFIVGPDQYRHLPRLLCNGHHDCNVYTRLDISEMYSDILPCRDSQVTGWITIMRGCNNFCTYCIVPYTRGRERSRRTEDILHEIESMAQEGIIEVTLLGQNVNSYNDGRHGFSDLLRMSAQIPGIRRVRFMTSHPKDLNDDILDVIATGYKICPHIHLPVQSGSNRILALMNRQYTREHYLSLVEKARKRIPGVALTTDVLVGFPGETESDFRDTYELLDRIRFDEAYTYRYSPREGTQAALLADGLTEKDRLKRLDEIIHLQRRITLEIKHEMIGHTEEILPETASKQSPQEWMGRTPTNHVVVFPKNGSHIGYPVNVAITECRGATLRGYVES